MYLDHFNIAAPRELLERVKNFYCAVFELTEGFRPNFSGSQGYWLYAGDRPLVHLSKNDKSYGEVTHNHLNHIAFRMTGLESMMERLEANGIQFHKDYVSEIGMTQLFFKDPAGNGLEANFVNENQ
jgi:catechol-2,3-dioxygenase